MSSLNVFQQTRDALFAWAARTHPKVLRAGVDLFFGDDPRTEEAAHGAIVFAMQLPDADGTALFERYAAAHPNLPRAQREALAAWRGARFGLFQVLEVEHDRGFHLRDLVSERDVFVHEKAGTHHIEAGAWLFALVIERGGRLELEGTLGLVPEAALEPARQAALQAYGGRTDVDAATSRRAMGPVMAAIHAAGPTG